MTRIVGLLVLIWLVVGPSRPVNVDTSRMHRNLFQRRDDRGDRDRRTLELLRGQPQSDELQRAQTQLRTHRAAPQSTRWP